jgi:hypothetical protein
MIGAIQLTAQEISPGRLFTNPAASLYDLTVLQYMVESLRQLLKQFHGIPPEPRPYILMLEEIGGRFHRLCLSRPETLLRPIELTVVGFCGQKLPGVDRSPLDAVDDELIEEMPQHPHLLSYSTLQLECRNTVNLVVFDDPAGLAHWAHSARHARAVGLSPQYYTVIRLHNASLPGGLPGGQPLQLLRTKYYDFQDGAVWRAVREVEPQVM